MAAPTKLTQQQVNILYEILDRFDQVCTEAGTQYVLNGGTALGAIRHKGLIPWDDDGDLFMFAPQFYNKSMELFTCAARYGLIIKPFQHANGVESTAWYKIYLGHETFPNVDIFVLEHDPATNNWVHGDPKGRAYFPTDYLTAYQANRFYRAEFGPLRLWMFPNHKPYFDRNYGNDWAQVAWDGYDHVNDIWKPTRSNTRSVGDYRPALPTVCGVI
jgi:lipopolysaccharide cholinephosphotransferase